MTDLDTVDWQLPLDMSDAELVNDGKGDQPLTYLKRILPLGEIEYEGRQVRFDQALHDDLAEAWAGKAFDGVPLFLDGPLGHKVQDAATGSIRDPERVRGWARDVKFMAEGPEGPGTYAELEFPGKKAAKAIRNNPFLAVSGRVKPNHVRQDGTTRRVFRHALQHILATTVPRVTGLGGFKPISLAEDDDREVVDLSGETVKELSVAKKKTETVETEPVVDLGEAGDLDLSIFDDAELLALLDHAEAEVDLALEDEPSEPEVEPEVTVDLAMQSRVEALEENERVLQAQLAESRWAREAVDLAEAGVPPFLIEEAAPILSVPGAAVIDLADDSEDPLVQARLAVRKMLDASKGLMDFADPKGYTAPATKTDMEAAIYAAAWPED